MITRDDFKKLKQLDRIEFLLTLKRIEEQNNYSFVVSFGYVFFFIFGFLLLVFLGTANLGGIEKALPLLNAILLLSKIGYITLGIAFVLDVVFWIRESKWKKQLREEYFKIGVKPRK